MHPEQYSDTLDDTQVEQLHKSLIHVCTTAVEILAQPEDIPDNCMYSTPVLPTPVIQF